MKFACILSRVCFSALWLAVFCVPCSSVIAYGPMQGTLSGTLFYGFGSIPQEVQVSFSGASATTAPWFGGTRTYHLPSETYRVNGNHNTAIYVITDGNGQVTSFRVNDSGSQAIFGDYSVTNGPFLSKLENSNRISPTIRIIDECPGGNSPVEFRIGGRKVKAGNTLGSYPATAQNFTTSETAEGLNGGLVQAYVGGQLVAQSILPTMSPAQEVPINFGTVVVGKDCNKPNQGKCSPCFPCTPKLVAKLNSLDLDISLGKASSLGIPLALRLKSESLAGLNNAELELIGGLSAAVEIIGAVSDPRRQVAAPQWLANIAEIRDGGGVLERIEIKLYHSQGTKAGGFYPGEDLFKTFTLTPGMSSGIETLQVEETESGGTKTSNYTHNPATGAWTLVTDSGATKVSLSEVVSGAIRTVTRELRDASDTLISKQNEIFTTYAWGELLTSRVHDPDGLALTETWEYQTNSSLPGYKRLSFRSETNGFWQRFTYDSQGRVTKLVSSHLNAAPTAAESECRVVNTTYNGANRTEWETLRGQEVSRRHVIVTTVNDITTKRVEVCTVPGAAVGATTSLATIQEFSATGDTVTLPDGTITKTSMSSLAGNGLRTTTETGKAASGQVIDGTRTVQDTDSRGNLISSTTTDIASNTFLTSATTSGADAFGRPSLIQFPDGSSEAQVFGCCGLKEFTDRNGVHTVFEKDAFGNVGSEAVAGITTTYQYDPLGRLRRLIRTGTDNIPITICY